MIETWLAILGLLLFGGWIWWITTGHYRHWPTSVSYTHLTLPTMQ